MFLNDLLYSLLLLVYVIDIPMVDNSDLFLYAVNSVLTVEHKDAHTIKNQLQTLLSTYVLCS